MIVIIDNYDSFTYNLYQCVCAMGHNAEVYRNDELTVEGVAAKKPSHIIISPGPCFPSAAGISIEVARKLGATIPVLGVCLGHQAIGEAFGGKVVHAPYLVHGKASKIALMPGCRIFDGLPGEITAGRYHSLVVDRETLPETLQITALTSDGLIMGLKHRKYEIYGIQFHPESILTPNGAEILDNFLKIQMEGNR